MVAQTHLNVTLNKSYVWYTARTASHQIYTCITDHGFVVILFYIRH